MRITYSATCFRKKPKNYTQTTTSRTSNIMIILLRQSNIKVGTPNDHSLTLAEAGFIWVKYLEVFDDRVEFMPLGQQDYEPTAIKKVNGDCWLEPNTGIMYEYFFVYPSEWVRSLPRHLEIKPKTT